jgi:catechol 2,3-dioxygenase-like lactoylglutathione lyase family enzyme
MPALKKPQESKKPKDNRPPVAIGHVRIKTHAVSDTIDFFKALGLRGVFRNDNFGVLELRGGTHLIVSGRDKPVRKGAPAPFDIMVDDIDIAHKKTGKRTSIPQTLHPAQSIHRFSSAPRRDTN